MVNTNDLRKLFNTLLQIETKGDSTRLMCECLTFTANLINESEKEDNANANNPE